MRGVTFGLVMVGLLLGGCDDDEATPGTDAGTGAAGAGGGSGGTGDGGTLPVRGACALDERVGHFQVQHEADPEDGYSAVSGEVSNGVIPVTILEKVGEEGDCQLLRRNNTFCDPPCGANETCDHDGSCIPFPEYKSVGTVSISGLAKDVSMDYPTYFDTQMPHPPFEPGASIVLRASGGDYDGFKMFGEGFAPIVIPDEAWVVTEGEPLTITWTAAAPSQARVYVRLNIDQHGNSPVELRCELEDAGSVTVSASLVDQLLGFGVSGYPNGHVFRRSVDSVAIEPGCVEFLVFSHIEGDLQVAGHIPCSGPNDCPPPMTCDLPTNTCI